MIPKKCRKQLRKLLFNCCAAIGAISLYPSSSRALFFFLLPQRYRGYGENSWEIACFDPPSRQQPIQGAVVLCCAVLTEREKLSQQLFTKQKVPLVQLWHRRGAHSKACGFTYRDFAVQSPLAHNQWLNRASPDNCQVVRGELWPLEGEQCSLLSNLKLFSMPRAHDSMLSGVHCLSSSNQASSAGSGCSARWSIGKWLPACGAAKIIYIYIYIYIYKGQINYWG